MLNKEELKVLIEREGISEFFNVIDCFYLEEASCTLYELETDYYAVMFRIFPPAYSGDMTEEVVSSAVTCGLPANTVIQFHQICSQNLSEHKKSYDETMCKNLDEIKLDHPEMLKELHDAHLKFVDRHIDNTVFEKTKLAFHLRDFVNTVTVLFPMRDESENHRRPEDLIHLINKFKASLASMFPQNVDENQYIRIMRELITPYNPLPEVFRDPSLDIRDHFTDVDSTLSDVGNGIIQLCRAREIEFDKQEGENIAKKANWFKRLSNRFNVSIGDDDREVTKESVSDDKYYAKVMSRKMFPEYADLYSITDLSMDYMNSNVQQQIPLPYVISLTVKIEDVAKSTDSVKQAAMWNKWQLDNVGKLAQYFPELQMRASEADDVINIIDRKGEIPIKANWSIIIYSKDKHSLGYYSEIVKSNFQRKAFIIQEEDLITTNVFMYSLPMKYDEIYREFSRRFQTIFKANVASITPLGTDSRGFGQEPVVQLFGRNGQAQSFDLYDRNAPNKNAVIIAPSGRGKSFFTQRIVWSYLKQNAKIRIIDSGHSYRHLCTLVGGQYITFPEGNNICINPFTNARRDENGEIHEDEISNISNLVGIMAGYDLSESGSNVEMEMVNTLTAYISDAVKNAFDVHGDDAGMQNVGESLRNQLKHLRENATVDGDIRDGDIDKRLPGLITALGDFTNPNGIYYSYVNGRSNITFEKNLVVLDVDDLGAKQKRFKDFVISTITNAVEREFYNDRDNHQRKIFLIDEAWQLLDGKAGSTILGLYRKSRKMRGCIITVTQSINDFHLNDHIKGIYENAYWRLFLEQDGSTMQTALDEGKLVVDPFAFSLLQTVETRLGEYSEVMIMTQTDDLMIGRVLATRVEYWVSTQEEGDVNTVVKVMKNFNVNENIARLSLGYSEMDKTSVEEEITRLLGYRDRAIDELLNEEVAS